MPSNPSPASVSVDRDFVERLVSGDESAWLAVERDFVHPFVMADAAGVRSRCERAGVSSPVASIASRLYLNLSKNGFAPLRAFRFECAFSSWLHWQIRNAAQGVIRETAGPLDVDPDDGLLETLSDPRTLPPDRAAAIAELRKRLNEALAALWKKTPLGAITFLLRGELGIPSRKVAALVGRKPAAVDQTYRRARLAMKAVWYGLENLSAAGLCGRDAAGMAAGTERLAFEGGAADGKSGRWLVEVDLPDVGSASLPEAPLLETRLRRRTGLDGVFRLCGVRIPIRKGAGLLPWKTFVASIAAGGVSFEPSGTAPIPGAPVFASLVEIG